jgi:periplasmic protein TonB
MILNTWIGTRPPTSEFKRDILKMPKDKAGTDLLARFDSTRPSDGRRKTIVSWGGKIEEPAPAPAPAPVAAPEPKPKKPEVVAVVANKPEPEAKPKPEPREAPAVVAAPTPAPAPAPVAPAPRPTPTPKPAPAPVVQQPDTASLAMAQKAREEKEAQQQNLYNEYLLQIRRAVNRKTEYPRRAVKDTVEGLVVLRVEVDRGGNLLGIDLAQSAHDLLDQAAQTAVKNAAPFTPANDLLEGSKFQFLVPIVFKLTK